MSGPVRCFRGRSGRAAGLQHWPSHSSRETWGPPQTPPFLPSGSVQIKSTQRAGAQGSTGSSPPRGEGKPSWRRRPPGWAAATGSRKGPYQRPRAPVSAHNDQSLLKQTHVQRQVHLPEALSQHFASHSLCGSCCLRCPSLQPGTQGPSQSASVSILSARACSALVNQGP